MISEESAALHHIVTAARDKRGAYNTHNLSEKVVMLFKSTRVGAVDLQLRVCPKETRRLQCTEEIGV
jgi:hypothetical protein